MNRRLTVFALTLPLLLLDLPWSDKACAQAPQEITNSIGMKLVLIPKGSFMMGAPAGEEGAGDDEEQHEVVISNDFYLGQTEVTQGQFERVMGTNPSHFRLPRSPQDDRTRHPVESVSWHEAVEFCERLSSLPAEKEARRLYRLPYQSEWEYACRAGSQTPYFYGSDPEELGSYAWFNDNSGNETQPVGEKQPNRWGLYDMHGNVWEWCADWFGEYPAGPVGPKHGVYRVLRGGGIANAPVACRSAYRIRFTPSLRNRVSGFRIALTAMETATKSPAKVDQPSDKRTDEADKLPTPSSEESPGP